MIKKFIIGWALITGMIIYTIILGMAQGWRRLLQAVNGVLEDNPGPEGQTMDDQVREPR